MCENKGKEKKNAAVTRSYPLAGCKLETWVWALSQGEQAGRLIMYERGKQAGSQEKRRAQDGGPGRRSPWQRGSGWCRSNTLHALHSCGLCLLGRLGLVTITARGFTSANAKQYSTQVKKQNSVGTSLVVQRLRICLAMQGTQVQSLVWELRSHMLWSN